ncbi:hypothetical protein PFISCL1PPCAC_2465, partial [Pristionchus fissidentatus]
ESRSVTFEKVEDFCQMDCLSNFQWQEVCDLLHEIYSDKLSIHGEDIHLTLSDLYGFLRRNKNVVYAHLDATVEMT